MTKPLAAEKKLKTMKQLLLYNVFVGLQVLYIRWKKVTNHFLSNTILKFTWIFFINSENDLLPCSKSTIESLKKGVKYVQSWQ